jgi:chemotaxis methyl-accepting protein methylase
VVDVRYVSHDVVVPRRSLIASTICVLIGLQAQLFVPGSEAEPAKTTAASLLLRELGKIPKVDQKVQSAIEQARGAGEPLLPSQQSLTTIAEAAAPIFFRRLRQRASRLRMSLGTYARHLLFPVGSEEANDLHRELEQSLVVRRHHSTFFRSEIDWIVVERYLRRLVAAKRAGGGATPQKPRRIRIGVLAGGYGMEAYSIAAVLAGLLDETDRGRSGTGSGDPRWRQEFDARVVSYDIGLIPSLRAQAGIYPKLFRLGTETVPGIPQTYLDEFPVLRKHQMTVVPGLRDMVEAQFANLDDPYQVARLGLQQFDALFSCRTFQYLTNPTALLRAILAPAKIGSPRLWVVGMDEWYVHHDDSVGSEWIVSKNGVVSRAELSAKLARLAREFKTRQNPFIAGNPEMAEAILVGGLAARLATGKAIESMRAIPSSPHAPAHARLLAKWAVGRATSSRPPDHRLRVRAPSLPVR